MPISDDTKNEVYRLYHWLTFLDLERGLKEYGNEKGYHTRIAEASIDGVDITDFEKYINDYKQLPFYQRMFFSLFSPINEFVDLFLFYKAKQLLHKLDLKADFDAVKWQEALKELKELDRQAQNNLSFVNLKYIWARISEWPVKAKNKDYIFNNVKYAFSNPDNWRIGAAKTLSIQERQKMRDLDDLAQYFHDDIFKKCDSEEFDTITDEKIESRKWQISDFKESISNYYYCPSWDFSVKDKCIETVKVIHDYLTLAINKVINLLPLATHGKCIKAFKAAQTPENSAKLHDAGIKHRDTRRLPTDTFEAVQNFGLHQFDATFNLHKHELDNIEESVKIEESEEQYRRAHLTHGQ